MIALHHEVKRVSNGRAAAVLSKSGIEILVLQSLINTVGRQVDPKASSFPFPDVPQLSFRLVNFAPDTAKLTARAAITKQKLNGGGTIDVCVASIDQPLKFSLTLHITNRPDLVLSNIELQANDVHGQITAVPPRLKYAAPDFDLRILLPNPVDPNLRKKIIDDNGLTEQQVAGVEGAVQLFVGRKIVSAALYDGSIDLESMFPRFTFHGLWDLTVAADAVVIIPSDGITLSPNGACPNTDTTSGLKIDPGDLTNTSLGWEVTLPPPLKTITPSVKAEGLLSIFTPKTLWDQTFDDFRPALAFTKSDNGFIGWDVNANVSLSKSSVSIDPATFSIKVVIDVKIFGIADLNVDVPCVGRCGLGNVRFESTNSTLVLDLKLDVISGQQNLLVLRSGISEINLNDLNATVVCLSMWLALAGGIGAVTGFVADIILGKVLAHNLRIKLAEFVRDAVNRLNLNLLDLTALGNPKHPANLPTFSSDADSLLLGIYYDG